jgi:hypothetical protein
MSESAQQTKPNPTIFEKVLSSEALLLALFPITIYVLAYIFQAGYLSYFRITAVFMNFSTSNLLVVGNLLLYFFLVSLVIFIYIVIPVIYIRSRLLSARRARFLELSIFFVATAYFVVYIYSQYGFTGLVLFLVGVVAPSLTLLLWPGLLQNLRKYEDSGGLFVKLIKRIGLSTLIIFALLLGLGPLIVFRAGGAVAATREVYLVTNTTPEMVALYFTEERVILVPLNRNTNEVEPIFTVLSMEEMKPFMFRHERVGPLRLNEDAIANPPSWTLVPISGTPTP